MRRSRTPAYLDFVDWVRVSRKPTEQALAAYAKGDDIWQYLLCSVVVLTHSRFERYFRDVTQHLIAEINKRGKSADKLPGLLWGAMLQEKFPHDSLKRFYLFGNEREFLESLEKLLTAAPPLDFSWQARSHVGAIDFKTIVGESTYPTFERLQRIFYKSARVDFRGQVSQRLKSDAENVLTEVGGLRGAMAHEGMPPGLIPADVISKLKRLNRLVKCMDEVIQHEIVGRL